LPSGGATCLRTSGQPLTNRELQIKADVHDRGEAMRLFLSFSLGEEAMAVVSTRQQSEVEREGRRPQ
jgi:hypothetical protein